MAEWHEGYAITGISHRGCLSIFELRNFQMVDFYVETFFLKKVPDLTNFGFSLCCRFQGYFIFIYMPGFV